MEWVETTGKTVEEALDAALDQLGVDEADAEYEVLEEPKSGLFGRVRSEARIRARVLPTKPRAKEERRGRRKPGAESGGPATSPASPAEGDDVAAPTKSVASKSRGAKAPANSAGSEATAAPPKAASGRAAKPKGGSAASAISGTSRAEASGPFATQSPEEESVVEVAEEFLSGLLDEFGVSASLQWSRINEETLQVEVAGQDLGMLIGPKAQTLYAIQDLLRTIVHYEVGDRTGRLLLDISGYREKRRVALAGFAQKIAAEVVATGERRALEPMVASDRKVVHDTCNCIAGVSTISEGEDPGRRVVILPA